MNKLTRSVQIKIISVSNGKNIKEKDAINLREMEIYYVNMAINFKLYI